MTKIDTAFTTPEATFVYPTLLQARAYMENGKAKGEPRFSVKVIFDIDAEFKEFVSEYKAMAKQHFGDDIPTGDNDPFKKGSVEAARLRKLGKKAELADYLEGKAYLNVGTGAEYPPDVYDVNYKKVIDPKMVFSGCRGHIAGRWNFFTDQKTAASAANAYLNSVLIVPGGEPIKGLGGADPKSIFGSRVKGQQSSVDPTEDDEVAW